MVRAGFLPPRDAASSVAGMRSLLLLLALTSTAFADEEAEPAEAEDGSGESVARGTAKGTIGLGLVFGDPTGISARLYLQDDQAIQAAVGWSMLGGGLHVSADYVFHPIVFQSRDSFVLAGYVGPGLRMMQYRKDDDERTFAFGVRAVAGLLFDFTIPLDAFVEAGAIIELESGGEGIGLAPFVAAGVRYYF